jgi:hypothetical protein
MFGHTLIRVDSKGHTGASRMLDYTINYAADAAANSSVGYAYKGLSGGLPGRFRIIPYHMKLREYAQMENRDIWEYRLDVSQQTVDMVLMHAWELIGTYFDYYFFTENCAYHILTLLESDLHHTAMTDEFRFWVLPTDTLRVLEERGLVRAVDYYPSSYQLILARRNALPEKDDRLAKAIYRDGTEAHQEKLDGFSIERQASVLDMAYEYLRYTKIAASDVLSPELSERERRLLVARSRLRVTSPEPDVPVPGVRPDQAHRTMRWSVGGGSDDNGPFVKVGWRAVYHDWLDPAAGYPSNSALEFGRLGLRYYTEGQSGKQLKLDHLYVISLDNFEPLDDFFRRVSWHVTTGWEPLFNAADKREIAFTVRGGPGLSYRPGGASTLLYGGVDAEAAYGDAFRGSYYLGTGPTVGVMHNQGDRWRVRLSGRYLMGVAEDTRDRGRFDLEQSIRLTEDASLNFGVARRRELDGWMTEGKAWLNVYF